MPNPLQARTDTPTALIAAIAVVLITVGWLAGQSATASRTTAVAPPTSVAAVRLVELFDALDEKTALETQFQAFIAEREAQLQEVVSDLETAQADLEILRPGTAPHRDKARELLELRSLAETRQRVLQDIVSIEKGNMFTQLYAKSREAAGEIAKRQGYDIVLFDDSDALNPVNASEQAVLRFITERRVAYVGPSVNITAQVATYMNNAFQAGGSN